jgi:CDGSH-type Zn-finger protein
LTGARAFIVAFLLEQVLRRPVVYGKRRGRRQSTGAGAIAMADTDEEPRIAQKGPYKAELLATYRYAWCRCGLSKMQPWCDGSHTSTKTGIMPVVWTQEKDKTVFLCGCKRSGNKPFCDSTHKAL